MNNYTSNINDFIHHISSIDHEPVSNLLYARTSRPLLDSVYAATEVSTQLQINRDLTEIRNFTDVPNSKPYEILHNNIKNGLTSLKRHRERMEIEISDRPLQVYCSGLEHIVNQYAIKPSFPSECVDDDCGQEQTTISDMQCFEENNCTLVINTNYFINIYSFKLI